MVPLSLAPGALMERSGIRGEGSYLIAGLESQAQRNSVLGTALYERCRKRGLSKDDDLADTAKRDRLNELTRTSNIERVAVYRKHKVRFGNDYRSARSQQALDGLLHLPVIETLPEKIEALGNGSDACLVGR